ncbi:hypothetical protein DVH24_024308, partial [Malus domestica]
VLSIGLNNFGGVLPESISNLSTKLTEIYFHENQIRGIIPSNQLQGSIPQSLGDCRLMLYLDLSHNNLSGPIPKQVINLLVALDLSRNKFTESIPMEVGNLQHLVFLDVSENKLSGEIPQSLGSCTNGLNLHKFARIALPELVEEICDPVLLQVNESSTHSNTANNRKGKDLLVLQICRERMNIGHVEGLCLVRDVLTGTWIPRIHMITA